MNYKHIYHAGSFVDVMKHAVLVWIVEYLQKKAAAFCYIDTHAGAGIYDLTSPEAMKTGEAEAGVQRIIQGSAPAGMQSYLELLKIYQSDGKLLAYPGSPMLVQRLLRPQDVMILNEYHSETNRLLKQNLHLQSQVAVHRRDAYEFLPAILPPPVARGLVLIDPPFEQKDEHEKIQLMLQKSCRRWAHGIYMIWYPITTRGHWDLSSITQQHPNAHFLIAELTIAKKDSPLTGLIGCQLLILNPPWQLADSLRPLLKYLWEVFSINGQGGYSVNKFFGSNRQSLRAGYKPGSHARFSGNG
jgi:23S rRNA (adenine2030-N6)-methyltransferase